MSKWLDLSVLGDKELDARLDALERGAAMKAVRPGLRAAMKAILPVILALVPVDTGKLRGGKWKIRAARRKRGRVGVAILSPTRQDLGILPTDPYYYPAAPELGLEGRPARSFMRAGLKSGEQAGMEALKRTLWERLERIGMGRDQPEDPEVTE